MLSRAAAVAGALFIASLATLPAGAPASALSDPVRAASDRVLRRMDAPAAWKVTRGEGVTVAVLDSGVDGTHRDLEGTVTATKDFTKGANPPGVAPKRLHGTYMASLIAGQGKGVKGVAPDAKILSARVILEDEEAGFGYFNGNHRWEGTVTKGIRYAVAQGADVINLSLSKASPTQDERKALIHAISKGVVVVAAAGNDGNAKFSYPASFPGVISVAALGSGTRQARFSNRNGPVIGAPGVKVMGAGPGDEYWLGDGTSQSSALVAGVAALIKAEHPKLPPPLVAQAIIEGARHKPRRGYSAAIGFGEVNAAAALKEAAKLTGFTEVAESGRDPSVRLAPDAGPIQVVQRDTRQLVIYGAVVGVCGIGLIAAVVAVVIALRRRPRYAPPADGFNGFPPMAGNPPPFYGGPQ